MHSGLGSGPSAALEAEKESGLKATGLEWWHRSVTLALGKRKQGGSEVQGQPLLHETRPPTQSDPGQIDLAVLGDQSSASVDFTPFSTALESEEFGSKS